MHSHVDFVFGGKIFFRGSESLRAARGELQTTAFGGERFGDAVTDAARAAGGERGAPLEIEFHKWVPEK